MVTEQGVMEMAKLGPGQPVRSTITERLESEAEQLKTRLKEIEKVLVVLKSKPDVQEVLDALSRMNIVN